MILASLQFDKFSDYLKTINHLNFKSLVFVGILQISLVKDFGNSDLSPLQLGELILFTYLLCQTDRYF